MYKLEGRLASVLAKIEADQSRWLETQQLHDAYQKKETLAMRIGTTGCALPFLSLFLYGFNFVPHMPWGLVFSLTGHFLRGDNTRISRESLTQESEYPVREEHNYRVLLGEFQLPDGTPASLRIVRRHEAELQSFSESYYVGGKLTSGTVIQTSSEQNEDCYELVLPEDFEPKSLPEGIEVHQEKDRTILKSTTNTESMELDLKPALTLLRSAINSRA